VGIAKRVLACAFHQRAGDLLARDQAVGADQETPLAVEDGRRDDDSFGLEAVAAQDPGCVDGSAGYDEACTD